MKRRSILAIAATAITLCAGATGLTDSLNYHIRLGYNIGGTAPIGIPATIRQLNKYTLKSNISFAFDIQKDLWNRWGLLTGLHVENKGMKVDATVKNYHIEMVKGSQKLTGYFTGRNVTNVEEWLLTIPVMGTYAVNNNLRLKLGPYLSFVMSRKFDGYAYNGHLREGTPTGDWIEIQESEDQRGSYDFSDDMRKLQMGIDLGADWYFSKRWGLYADITWGLTGIHHSNFKTIDQTLYPIFGTVGVTYRLK